MKIKILVLLVILGLVIGLTAQSAKAGPPWPASVTREQNVMITDWLADDLVTTTWIYSDLLEVYNPHSGIMTITSNGRIDYSSPDFASLDQICGPESPYAFLCNGGTLKVPRGMFTCINRFGDVTLDAQAIATSSGQFSLVCHFKDVCH